jgi:hypothetical protein
MNKRQLALYSIIFMFPYILQSSSQNINLAQSHEIAKPKKPGFHQLNISQPIPIPQSPNLDAESIYLRRRNSSGHSPSSPHGKDNFNSRYKNMSGAESRGSSPVLFSTSFSPSFANDKQLSPFSPVTRTAIAALMGGKTPSPLFNQTPNVSQK